MATGYRLVALMLALTAAIVVSTTGAAAPQHSNLGYQAPAVVRLGIAAKVPDINPTSMIAQEDWIILSFVYSPLVMLTGQGTAKPNLASSWAIAKNGKSFTFSLRPNLRFSTGKPLTAADVVATFRRLRSNPNFIYAGNIKVLQSIRAAAGRKVVMKLSAPSPGLLPLLGQPQFGIFPASVTRATEKSYFTGMPVSAGPYKFASYSPNTDRVVLTANERYWGSQPSVKRLEFPVIPGTAARVAQLQAGQIDMADALSATAIPQLQGKVRANVLSVFGNSFFIINNKAAPLNDVRVRRAIALALDRNRMNSVALSGRGKPAYSFWAPTSQWYRANVPRGPNVGAARQLLAQTACASGCDLKITISSANELYRSYATVAQENLKAIGLNVTLSVLDQAAAFGAYGKGEFDLAVAGLFDYTDEPDVMLSYGLLSSSGALFSGYNSPQMDAVIPVALATTGAKKKAAIARINTLFAQDLPYVPLMGHVYVNGSRVNPRFLRQTSTSLYATTSVNGRPLP